MEIFFKTEESSLFLSKVTTQIVELRGLTVNEVETTIKFYNGLKAARELNETENEVLK
ncbi:MULTISPECIES: hypothetical protein [Lactococcus]|uniref:hypothetical protein n=1 Tax=Lactococcus TaxID=1357 RepID=UPI0022E5F935|nr:MULTISPECIES: hypothetical protein [Lactococcus]MDG6123928.1 hypothetical protein [Lactococcus formosensis]